MVPYVIDEFMPRDLWEVVKSDDPSKPPSIEELKCVEIQLISKGTYANGSERKNADIYRIDLTRETLVVYKREIIPKEEQQKHNSDSESEDELLTALLDVVQPFPRFKYVEVENSTAELEKITKLVMDCRKESKNTSEAGTKKNRQSKK